MSKDERIRILFAEDLHTDVDLARRKISRVFPEMRFQSLILNKISLRNWRRSVRIL